MSFEKWDVLNQDGLPIGKTVLRGSNTLLKGEFHLVVHIWIVSSDGKLLIQRRSDKKKLMPGEWAATGGAAISGEDSFTAASRELFEELGIKTNASTLKKELRFFRRNSIIDIWFTQSNLNIDSLTLQTSEVSEAKWVTEQELKSMINSGKFHNYGEDYFSKIFEKIGKYKGVLV